MTRKDHPGSYVFRNMQGSEFELKRLKLQARAMEDLEVTILRDCGLLRDDTVVELGCGPGYITSLLSDQAPSGMIYAIDRDYQLISQLQKTPDIKSRQNVFAIQAVADCLPFKDKSIDFIYVRFLLQHLINRDEVLNEVYRILPKGGRLCIVDSDDGLILYHPARPQIESILQSAQRAQTSIGGDRFIGRKLQVMLHDHSFSHVETRVICVTSSQIPFDVLFNILFGYKASVTGKESEIQRLYEELKPAVEAGDFFLAAGVFVSMAIKK